MGDEIPGIMLTLIAMVHEPHGFSASMIATGREPTLTPGPRGRRLCFSITGGSRRLCRRGEAASRPHPPTNDPTPRSCGYQSIPR